MLSAIRKQMVAMTFALVALLASARPMSGQSGDYTLRLENSTGYEIYQVRLSSVADRYWHRDLLGSQVF